MSNRKPFFAKDPGFGGNNPSRSAAGGSANRFSFFNPSQSRLPLQKSRPFSFSRPKSTPFLSPPLNHNRPSSGHASSLPGEQENTRRVQTAPRTLSNDEAAGGSSVGNNHHEHDLYASGTSSFGVSAQHSLENDDQRAFGVINDHNGQDVENENENDSRSYPSTYETSSNHDDREDEQNVPHLGRSPSGSSALRLFDEARNSFRDALTQKENERRKYEKERQSYQSKIEKLKMTGRSLKEQLVTVAADKRRFKRHADSLEKKVAIYEEDFNVAFDDVSSLTKRVCALGSMKQWEETTFNLVLEEKENEISQKTSEYIQLENELRYLQGKLLDETELKRSFENNLNKALTQLEDSRVRQKLSTKELTSRVEDTEHRLSCAHEALEHEKGKLQTAQSKYEDLLIKSKANETRISKLESSLKEMSENEKVLKDEHENLENKAKEERIQHRKEIENLAKEKKDLEQSLLEVTQVREGLISKVTEQKKNLQEILATKNDVQQELENLCIENTAKEQEVQIWKENANKASRKTEDALKLLRDERSSCQALRHLVTSASDDIDALTKTVGEVRQNVRPAFTELAQLRSKLESYQDSEQKKRVSDEQKKEVLETGQIIKKEIQSVLSELAKVKSDNKNLSLENVEAARVAHEAIMERLGLQRSLDEHKLKASKLESEHAKVAEELQREKAAQRSQQEKAIRLQKELDELRLKISTDAPDEDQFQNDFKQKKANLTPKETAQPIIAAAHDEEDETRERPRGRKRQKSVSGLSAKALAAPAQGKRPQPSLVRRKRRRTVTQPMDANRWTTAPSSRPSNADDDSMMFDKDAGLNGQ